MSTDTPLPVFVLTLEGAEERRAPLLRRLNELGVGHELFFGVDGRQGLPAVHEPLIDRSARVRTSQRSMTDGEYACTLSHLFISRQIVARGLARAIVLEDDAVIGTAFAALVRGQISLPGDLFLLDHLRGFYHWRGRIDLGKGLHGHRVAVAPFMATGYALTLKAARFFLDQAFPVRELADWPCDISGLKSYAVYPRIVGHPDPATAPSNLEAARQALRNKHLAKLRALRWKLWFGRVYWLRRKREWYRVRYRQLDAAIRLELSK